MARHFNITGSLTKELLAPGDNVNVSKISLTNIEGTNNSTVDLYIEKKLTGKFYFLKGVELPIDASLMYENIEFSNSKGDFGLYIKLSAASGTPAVDVILG